MGAVRLHGQGMRVVCQNTVTMVGGPDRQVLGWLICNLQPEMLDRNQVRCMEKKDVEYRQRLDQTVHTGVVFAPCACQPPVLLLLYVPVNCSNLHLAFLPVFEPYGLHSVGLLHCNTV